MGPNPPTAAKETQTHTSWGDNPRAAFLVRTAVFLAPLVVAFASTWLITRRWEAPTSLSMSAVRFCVLAVVAMTLGAATERAARRLLPLAALLRLSLVFPDQAPSRFAVAFRSGTTRQLERRLAELEAADFAGTEAEAAQLIVELAAALSRHDRLTRGHSERVRAYTALIAEEMAFSPEDSNRLQWAGLIHDVGKLKIPYEILSKPGLLTDREFEIIKAHPAEGMRIAAPLADFLGPWINAVGDHHERVDGTGYPNGLVGDDISLGGRIVAVADAYDVMTAARTYKKPESPEYARKELARCAGTQFDPVVVRAFLNVGLGDVRRAMWPLSWLVQLPFLGSVVTVPVSQAVAASVLTLATATGLTVATGGFDRVQTPNAIAMVEADDEIAEVADEQIVDLPAITTAPRTATTTAAPRSSTTTFAARASTTTTGVPATSTTASVSTTVAPTTSVATTTTRATTLPPTTTTTKVVVPPTTNPSTTTTTSVAQPLDDCERAQAGETNMTNADLAGCELAWIDLGNGSFNGANFTGANLEGVTLSGGSFVGANFANAQLLSVEASNTNFSGANFRNAVVSDGGFADSYLANADFAGALLEGGYMIGADLQQASFAGATITQWTFRNAQLVETDFTEAVLTDSSIKYAIADNALFRFASIENLWVFETSFVQTDFTNAVGVPLYHETAIYDGAICPNGEPSWQSCW